MFIFSVGLGMLRLDISDRGNGDAHLDETIGANIEIEGVVVAPPDEREFNTLLVIKAEKLFIGKGNIDIDTKILVSTDSYPIFEYGDRVDVRGKIRTPKNFITDTGREFNYVGFLEKDGIYYQMFNSKTKLVNKNNGNIIKEYLFSIKKTFLHSISKNISEPGASLLGGLLVGAKQSLGADLLNSFRIAGIIHIVVLSGYNVTIVADAIMLVFSFLPKLTRLFLGVGSILGFMIMVGAGATVVRASAMAIIVVFARMTGRMSEITIALIFTGLTMLLINPRILIFDPSFQLSFLATVGLIYLAPYVEKYLHFVPTKWHFREFAVATISTQIFVLPILLYMTGKLSVVALPVNLLVLAIIPATMFFGFIAGVVGIASSAIALPFAIITYVFLAYELWVVDLFSSLPFASFSVPQLSVWSVLIIYGIYMIVLLKMRTGNNVNIKEQEDEYEKF